MCVCVRAQAGSVNDFAFFDPAMASRLPRPKRARRATQKAAGGARAKVARKAKFTLDFSAQVRCRVSGEVSVGPHPMRS